MFITCQLDCQSAVTRTTKEVSFRRYNKIDLDLFRANLSESSFVKNPANTASALHNQYVNDLGGLLNVHAPLITRKGVTKHVGWAPEAFRQAIRPPDVSTSACGAGTSHSYIALNCVNRFHGATLS